MTHNFSKRIFSSQWRLLLLSALLVFVQFATVVHSEIHLFHEHSELCDVLYGVEHQSSDVVADFNLNEHSAPRHFEVSSPVFVVVHKVATVYSSRAPPVVY